MSENKKRKRKTDKAKRHLWHLWAASLVVLVVAIICCLVWKAGLVDFRSIDEKLAAIEAARAIPDAEIGVFKLRTKP